MAVTRLSPAADGTSDSVYSTSAGVPDGVARAKSEIISVVVGAGHVEALRSADAVDGLDSSAAVSALVEDLNSSLNVTHGRHS